MGGIVHRLLEVDPDRLSYFEIQDICLRLGLLEAVGISIQFLEVIWSMD